MQQEPGAEAFGLLLRLGKELWMSHAIEFIETSLFTRQIKSIATDDELKDLQKELIAWPDKGDLIMAYPKCIKDSLTEAEKVELKKLTSVLKNTASNAVNERCTMYPNQAGGG